MSGHCFRKFVEATKYVTEAEQYGFGNHSATTIDANITAEMRSMTWCTPGYTVTDDSPVSQVTWNDAVMFCNWLSEQENLKPCYHQDARDGWTLLATGEGYRLPTEAEWEYACRAGSTNEPTSGDGFAWLKEHAWFDGNPHGGAQSVAMKPPNEFGLFDMRGNVFEWCHDWYGHDYYLKSPPNDPLGPSTGNVRVQRGGGWSYGAVECHSGFRTYSAASGRADHRGFRVVRVTTKDLSVGATSGSSPVAPTASIDLLSMIDIRRHTTRGQWQRLRSALVSVPGQYDVIQLPYRPPDEYKMEITAERIKEGDDLQIGVVRGQTQCVIVLDGWGGEVSGISWVDGHRANENETTYRGRVFTNRIPTHLVVTVREQQIEVTANGRSIINWRGNENRLSLQDDLGTERVLFSWPCTMEPVIGSTRSS